MTSDFEAFPIPTVEITSLLTTGPTGATGPTGPIGPQGPAGPTGPIGEVSSATLAAAVDLRVLKSGDTMTGNLDVPSLVVDGGPLIAGGSLSVIGSTNVGELTATGDVTITNTAPSLDIIDSNGTSGLRSFRIKARTNVLKITAMDDALVDTSEPFLLYGSGAIDMTGASSVTVPALTATGDIDINKTNPLLLLENPGGGTDEKIFRIRNATGSLTVQSRTDANGTKQNLMTFDSGTGGVTVNQSLTVPAVADGATSAAAQVTARDSGTGQLAIAGIEMGDTGWRDVSSFLLNGWTGTLEWRRIGNDIIFRTAYGSAGLDGSAATSTVFLKPDALGVGCYWDTAFSAEARVLFYRSNGALIESEYWYINQWHAPGFGAAENKYGFFNGNEVRATARNDQGWPTSLPGTAA